MTTMPEPDDEMRALLEGMDFDEEPEVEDVSALSDHELVVRFNAIQLELRRGSEILVAKTDRGRDLHSINSALLVELRRRGKR